MATATPARTGPPFRLSVRGTAILVGVLGLVLLYATDQIVPATTDRQAEMRFWLAARATGIVAFLLLTFQIVLGLVLSHPTNRSTWNLSKRIFPWHDHIWVFVLAFLVAHIVSLVVDPKAGVSVAGAFIPGLSEYRSSPVAIGTLALYAFLFTAITARWTKLLPRGVWLKIHRLALVIWAMAWMHGVLAGTDTDLARRALHRGRPAGGPGRGVSLLGEPQEEADVRHVTTGGTRRMNITSMRLRRLITAVGVIAALVLGFGSIKAAAAWTAASAPLTVAPVPVAAIQDRLADEQARSADMSGAAAGARRPVDRDDRRARGRAGADRRGHRSRQGAREGAQGRQEEAGQARGLDRQGEAAGRPATRSSW